MSLFIASLNSGSNGNCYYIGNQNEAVLIDAGLSCRETEKRMLRSGLSMHKVRAVFITHEHSDHTKGTEFISRKYRIPVFITDATYRNSRLRLEKQLMKHFGAYAPVQIGSLTVTAFPKLHDASEPHSFIISGVGVTVGVLTDLGTACRHVVKNFGQCNAAFLEANYDEQMLERGPYPVYLKNRIRSEHGHLSNNQALELFTKHKSDSMSHLLLSHLSQDNNNPHMVERLFKAHGGGTHIAIASRHHESPVFQITGEKVENQDYEAKENQLNYIQPELF